MKKKLFLAVSVGLLAFFILTSGWFRFFVNVALLYAKGPDQKLSLPVQGVSRSQIGDSWHAPRDGERRHEGQDIFAPRGTPVLSATDGYVARIAENKLGGQTVWVIGAGGRMYTTPTSILMRPVSRRAITLRHGRSWAMSATPEMLPARRRTFTSACMQAGAL